MDSWNLIDKVSQQIRRIGGISVCYDQDGFHHQCPYFVRDGQLESVTGGLSEKASDGFVSLKPLHRAEDVVLHHGEREACDLCGEVQGLALSKVEQRLAILVSHLGHPAPGVQSVCLQERERSVRGEKHVPFPLPAALAEEQPHFLSRELRVSEAIRTFECGIVLTLFLLLEHSYDLVCIEEPKLRLVFRVALLDHSKQVAFDVAACHQAYELGAREPAVDEDVVKAEPPFDGVLDHLNRRVGLLMEILFHAGLGRLSLIALGETRLPLLGRESLHLFLVLALLAMEGEVDEQLAATVGEHQREAFVTKDALLEHMGPYAAYELGPHPGLGRVGVVYDQAHGASGRPRALLACLLDELHAHAVKQLAPVHIAVIHKTIEHVLLTHEHTAE